MLGDIFEEPPSPTISETEALVEGSDRCGDAHGLLAAALRSVLPQAELDPARSFFEHGGDSLAFVSFVLNLAVHIAEDRLESVRPDRPLGELLHLFEESTPAAGAAAPGAGDIPARARSGPVPMTSNRHAFLFRMPTKLDSWIIVSDLYEIDLPFVAERFHATIAAALAAFDGLRLRIRRSAAGFEQEIVPLDSVAAADLVTLVDAAEGDGDEALRRCAQRVTAEVTLGDAPFRVVVLRPAGRPGFGFVAICHHALIDAISNRVLRGFIVEAYRALSGAAEPAAPDAITYSRYCELYYEDCERRRERGLEYWRRQPWHDIAADPLAPASARAAGSSEEVAAFIAVPDFPAFCSTLRRSTGHTLETLAVAAIARAYGLATGRTHLCLGLVAHGRGSLPGGADARRTLGWITEVVPVVLATSEAASRDLDDIQDRMRESDRHGRLYGYLRHLDPNEEIRLEFERHPYPNMTLNILLAEGGQGPAYPRRSFGWDHDWHGERPFPMSGGLVGSADGVRLSWDFDIGLVAKPDVAHFLDRCEAALREALREAARSVPEGDGLRAWLPALEGGR